eukprot:TRINITY_DN20885_c0_g1_i1.p1 TRINITY_DN20885_c0_g1~~TRINITY_DN20885_c0_g1_i1.p1  ORF type:complete len:240 (-),score=13.70 TRINITY_DN20885_c0_g1_i1:142-861(-)
MADYMDDSFLVDAPKTKVSKSVEQIRRRAKGPALPKSARELEVDQRDEGLAKPIDHTNKGFQLLSKMGFKAGQGLGKHSQGASQGIAITLKRNRKGLGSAGDTERQKKAQKKQLNEGVAQDIKSYQEHRRNAHTEKKRRKDFLKCLRLCRGLDRMANKEDHSPFAMSPDLECESEEVWTDMEIECKWGPLVTYLREQHFYCHWCTASYDNHTHMTSTCPGPQEEDHCSDDDDEPLDAGL